MKKWIFLLMFLVVVTNFNACSTRQQTKSLRITLTNVYDKIVIPSHIKTLELARGPWVYVYSKEENLRNDEFFVFCSNYPEKKWRWATDDEYPGQAYAAAFYCVPKGKQEEQLSPEKGLKVEILPAQENIRESADTIRNSVTIKVSGIHFRPLKTIKGGQEQIYPPQVQKDTPRLFCVTDLQVYIPK